MWLATPMAYQWACLAGFTVEARKLIRGHRRDFKVRGLNTDGMTIERKI